MKPLISIVITTKNRFEDLRNTLNECRKLTFKEYEILVYDDGSIDSTSEMVRHEFPEVRLFQFEESAGLIPRRNAGAEAAEGKYIVSLDDDSWFLEPDALEKTLGLFDQYPQVGAIAYRVFDPKSKDPLPLPQEFEELARQYIGCGHALRRSVFLQLGGYRSFFQYGGEESEFCFRLMDMSYYVLQTRQIRVFHNQTQVERDIPKRHISAFRNQLLCAVLNEPWGRALPHLAVHAGNGLLFAGKHKLLPSYLKAWKSFFIYLPQCLKDRKPLRNQLFRYYDGLRKQSRRVTNPGDLTGL